VACQQSQRLRREPNSHDAVAPPTLTHESPAQCQQQLAKPSRQQLHTTKTRRLCGAPRKSSAPAQLIFSQSAGPPRPVPQHIPALWRGGSFSLASEVIGPAFTSAAVPQVAESSTPAFLRAWPNQSLKHRPTTAGHRAGEAFHVYHRPRRPGVPPQRSA